MEINLRIRIDTCRHCPFCGAYPTESNEPGKRSWGFRCLASADKRMIWERWETIPDDVPVMCPGRSGQFNGAWNDRIGRL
jgi:hypothetical protein